MIGPLLRRIADWADPPMPSSELAPAPKLIRELPVRCPNCGWDGKSDATPLLASLLEDARLEAVRVHASQGDTGSGRRVAS